MAQGRMLKASIRTSKSVNSLSDFNFRVWAYLITYVDDYGRGSADPEILKGFVFTRRKGITEGQIQKAVTDLANAGMINLYEVDGESYLYFPNWDKHQRIQSKKSFFPDPPSSTVTHGESPPEIEIEVEDEIETEFEVEKEKYEKEKAKSSGKTKDAFAEFAGDNDSLLTALREFEDMRKRIKKPLADGTKNRLVSKLASFPPEQWVAILNQSTDNCWKDIFPLKKEEKEEPKTNNIFAQLLQEGL